MCIPVSLLLLLTLCLLLLNVYVTCLFGKMSSEKNCIKVSQSSATEDIRNQFFDHKALFKYTLFKVSMSGYIGNFSYEMEAFWDKNEESINWNITL